MGALAIAAMACDTSTSVPGGNTIAGTFDGRPFDKVAATYVIGAPDDPAQTVVLYLFDGAVACADISSVGWDEVVPDQTQSLEIKLIGKTPGDYVVTLGPTLGVGQAAVNYTLTSTSGNPSEVSASGGTVRVDAIAGDGSATGSFDLSFPSGDMLAGTFNAPPCDGGKEP